MADSNLPVEAEALNCKLDALVPRQQLNVCKLLLDSDVLPGCQHTGRAEPCGIGGVEVLAAANSRCNELESVTGVSDCKRLDSARELFVFAAKQYQSMSGEPAFVSLEIESHDLELQIKEADAEGFGQSCRPKRYLQLRPFYSKVGDVDVDKMVFDLKMGRIGSQRRVVLSFNATVWRRPGMQPFRKRMLGTIGICMTPEVSGTGQRHTPIPSAGKRSAVDSEGEMVEEETIRELIRTARPAIDKLVEAGLRWWKTPGKSEEDDSETSATIEVGGYPANSISDQELREILSRVESAEVRRNVRHAASLADTIKDLESQYNAQVRQKGREHGKELGRVEGEIEILGRQLEQLTRELHEALNRAVGFEGHGFEGGARDGSRDRHP